MYIDKIINKRSPSLILCLAGWSTSPELFRHLEVPEQTDLWIAYDYRTLGFEETFAPYKEVHLVAWSLGVWVATRLWAGHRSFTTATALNGTPFSHARYARHPDRNLRGNPPSYQRGRHASL